MTDLIGQIVSNLGVDRERAESATGAILNTLQGQAPAGEFQKLLKAVPGASEWMSKAASLGAAESGGGAGGLAGAAAGLLGGAGGQAQGAAQLAGLASLLQKTGLDVSTAAKLIPLVMGAFKSQLGDEGFGKLAAAVPFVSQAMGGGSGSSALGAIGKLF